MHTLEEKLDKRLKSKLGEDDGASFMSRYITARDKSFADIISQISGSEPDLTKHDITHIRAVLTRVDQLLDDSYLELSVYDLYVLCMIVLFHDVGNIFGRRDHQTKQKVAKVYNHVRGNDPRWNQERLIILKAVEAHTGRSQTGQPLDTLSEVDEVGNLENGQKIRLRELATILRFADELEEGPGRTSLFKQQNAGEKGGYSQESLPYHEYANITDVFIDRGGGRIVLTYHLNWDKQKDPDCDCLKKVLAFCFQRILKLDDERKYARYYSKLLDPFRKTEVSFQFTVDNLPVDIGLEPIQFHDEIPVPRVSYDDHESALENKSGSYKIDAIIEKLTKTAP
jgi:hypothetical protein